MDGSGGTAALPDEDVEDEYYEYNDDRPTLDPVERPTDQRGERPMRPTTGSRRGPIRRKFR
jgi:hypothetical protein